MKAAYNVALALLVATFVVSLGTFATVLSKDQSGSTREHEIPAAVSQAVSPAPEKQSPPSIVLPQVAINYIPTEPVEPNLVTFNAFRIPGGWESQRNDNGIVHLPVWRFDSPDGKYTAVKYLPLPTEGRPEYKDIDPYFEGSGYIHIVATTNSGKPLVEYTFPKFTSENSIEWISNTSLALTLSGGEGGGFLEATQIINTDGSVVQTKYRSCIVGESEDCKFK